MSLAAIITRLDPDGSLSLRALAAKLTAEDFPTPAGAAVWTAATVARLKARTAKLGDRPALIAAKRRFSRCYDTQPHGGALTAPPATGFGTGA